MGARYDGVGDTHDRHSPATAVVAVVDTVSPICADRDQAEFVYAARVVDLLSGVCAGGDHSYSPACRLASVIFDD